MIRRNEAKQALRWALRTLGLVAALGCAACLLWAGRANRALDDGFATLEVLNDAVARTNELRWKVTTGDHQADGQVSEQLAKLRGGVAELTAGQQLDQHLHQLVIRADALLTQAQRVHGEAALQATQHSNSSSSVPEVAVLLGEAIQLSNEAVDLQRDLIAKQTARFRLSLGIGLILACVVTVLAGYDAILFVRVSRSRGRSGTAGSVHQLLAAAVRSTDEGVLISDTGKLFGDPTIVFANESFKEMSGLTDQELVGKSLSSLRQSCLREEEFSLLEHSYSDSRSATMETVRWRDDGSKVHCQWHISPVREESGRVTHYISILSDTTRLREHEEAQQRNHEKLMAVNRQLIDNQEQLIQSEKMAFLGQLAAGVAHEINNPLGYVMSNLEVLSEDVVGLLARVADSGSDDGDSSPSADEVRQILDESITGLDRVADIVRRLKNFARPADETLEDASINHEIEEALKIVWNEIKNKCDVTKDLGELPPMRCRPGQLNQVFTNLLLNAAQAIPNHGQITVQTGLEGADIVIRIADDGEGIPEENLPRLFTPFFTTKPAGKGTGLGLSVSYGIVQKHSGTIEVESTPGHGSVFTVRLPAEPQAIQ